MTYTKLLFEDGASAIDLKRGPDRGVRVALENAASVAGLLLLTEATLTERTEKKELP